MQRVRLSSHQAPVQKLGGSQISLSPMFRLGLMHTRMSDSSLDTEFMSRAESLIPGLPDDIALDCLLRVPVECHGSGKTVCKGWYLLFGCKQRFFTRRKVLGYRDPWLYVFAIDRATGKIQWQVLDLVHLTWHTIPNMPCSSRVCPYGFRCVAMPDEGFLYVCGGAISDVDCPLDLVLKYEMQTNKWTVMNKMITARSSFASGVIDGNIYAAGGNSSNMFELNAAEAFDLEQGTWKQLPDMGMYMASYDAAVLNKKLLITEGWQWPFYVSPRGQVYDPKTNQWETMSAGLREGWTGSSIVVHDRLFVVSEHERMKVKVYYPETDTWDTVEGSPLPEQIHKPFTVTSCENRVYVVGRNLHLAIGYISQVKNTQKVPNELCSFRVCWKVVDAPKSLSSLTPLSTQVLFG